MGGFLVINPRSGQGSNADELRNQATELGLETHVLGRDEDPAEVARQAPHGPLGMAGGDGSLAAVADVAIEREVPFVVVPFGTFNHFARDLGLDRDDPARGPAGVLRTRADGSTSARVNGRLFLNNVSLGLYARLVHESGTRRFLRAAEGARPPPATAERPRHERSRAGTSTRGSSSSRTTATSSMSVSLGERARLDEGVLYLYIAHGWLPSTWEEQPLPDVHRRRPGG